MWLVATVLFSIVPVSQIWNRLHSMGTTSLEILKTEIICFSHVIGTQGVVNNHLVCHCPSSLPFDQLLSTHMGCSGAHTTWAMLFPPLLACMVTLHNSLNYGENFFIISPTSH